MIENFDIQTPEPRSIGDAIIGKESLLKSMYENRKARLGIYIFLVFIGMAIYGRFFTPYSPFDSQFPSYLKPSLSHLLGTDYGGHDVFSQFMYGTGVSLWVGAMVALISVFVGTFVGLISGYYSGIVDNLLMRIVDILLILPTFPLLVILSTYFRPTITSTILILGILGWPFMSRVIRSQTLTIRERPFIKAAILSGMPGYRIVFSQIFKFVLPLIIINAVYAFVGAIVAQAGLAFFGLGDLASVNWGTMLYYAQNQNAVIYSAWWWIVPPGISIAVLGIAANIFGSGVNEVFGKRSGSI